MDKIDIRDQILRTFKEKGFDEQNCSFFKEEDIVEIAETIVENLPICVVMQQRELLVAFADWLQYNGKWDLPEKQADNFLKENSN